MALFSEMMDEASDATAEIARLTVLLRQAEADRDSYKDEMIRAWVALFNARRFVVAVRQ